MTTSPQLHLRAAFDAAVAAADPMQTIPACLGPRPEGRLVVIGAGKASARMAEAVEASWGPCDGLVLTRYGYGRPTAGIEIVEAAHPVPDAAGVAATRRMLALVDSLGPEDHVLALISGGGSALLCAPAAPMTLEDKCAVNAALLESGAPIGVMNTIRKHLSRIKGGQLAAAAHPAPMRVLMISDVPGDDPADIASGPTVGENTTAQDALALLAAHNITLPTPALVALEAGSSVVAKTDPRLATTENMIISAPSQSLGAAARVLDKAGVQCRILGDAIEGEARDEAARQVALARDIQRSMAPGDAPVVLLSGGECTVSGWGGGVGGPNAEFVLAAGLALDGAPGIHVLACDTDGVDGAAEVAGAVIGSDMRARANVAGVDADAALAASDSHGFFGKIGAQIVTGPTLTNVNDFRAIWIAPLV